MLSGKCERLLTGLLVAAAALSADASWAQSPQRQAPVEVTTPKAPMPVTADGRKFLVYELHVTNFGSSPLALRSVDVYAAGAAKLLITTLRDSTLRAAVRVIGAAMSMNGGGMTSMSDAPRVIEPGQRAVVFLTLEISARALVPTTLRHRLTFGIADTSAESASSSAESVLDSAMTPVNRAAAPILRAPMNGGEWLVGEGLSNASDHRRTILPLDGRAWLSQRFAIDFVKIGPNGNTWHDDRSRNDNYWGFGAPVLAVADGEVVAAVDSFADNARGQVPLVTLTNIAGNHVILRIGPAQYALYAHLQRGSLRVQGGQRVKRGEVVALLGNSGNTSGPHLHFQLMDAPSALAAEGIPFAFERFTFLGFGRDFEPGKHPGIPRQRELPLGDAVVRLPE